MYYLTCAHEEKCLSSSADGKSHDHYRHLLRFTSQTMNWGTVDFLPNLQQHEWIWHSCHNHYHSFEAFVHYDLLNVTTRKKVAEGHKASFCLEDSLCRGGSSRYRCGTGTQGISANCGDVYGTHLDCQWIDVTDVPIGTYILRQNVNPDRLTPESDYHNNAVECTVQIYPGFYLLTHSCELAGELKIGCHVRPSLVNYSVAYFHFWNAVLHMLLHTQWRAHEFRKQLGGRKDNANRQSTTFLSAWQRFFGKYFLLFDCFLLKLQR